MRDEEKKRYDRKSLAVSPLPGLRPAALPPALRARDVLQMFSSWCVFSEIYHRFFSTALILSITDASPAFI